MLLDISCNCNVNSSDEVGMYLLGKMMTEFAASFLPSHLFGNGLVFPRATTAVQGWRTGFSGIEDPGCCLRYFLLVISAFKHAVLKYSSMFSFHGKSSIVSLSSPE